MAIDPTKPLLRLAVSEQRDRLKGKQDKRKRPAPLPKDGQSKRFGPRFDRLREVLEQDHPEMVLKADPAALAPERLLVFELQRSLPDFAEALNGIDGLSLVDEDEADPDDGLIPHLYLLVPDMQALKEIESLWRRWQRGKAISAQYQPWTHLFQHLRDIRTWQPQDRLGVNSERILRAEMDGRPDDDLLTLELEMVYRAIEDIATQSEASLRAYVRAHGGEILSRARLPDIGYHAVLVRLPISEVRNIVDLAPDSIAGLDEVMFICPQSLATGIEVTDAGGDADDYDLPAGDSILAVLDGVPVSQHPAIAGRLNIEDLFDLEPQSQVLQRKHGTAMASLVIRGDLNIRQAPLPRPIQMIPVLGGGDFFPSDRLVVDMVYTAVKRLFVANGNIAPLAPHVLLINLSLGNRNCLFDRKMSAWARLLDRLSHEHDILFVVSAGNHGHETLSVPDFDTWPDYEDAEAEPRAINTLRAIQSQFPFRRLMSPSESINSLTIGACNEDAIADATRRSTGVDPFQDKRMPNPSSAIGPGFGNSVKPDLLFPGGREHLRMAQSGGGLGVGVCIPSAAHGLKVAGTNIASQTPFAYSGNTSGATALASRTCHQIHDALEDAYGEVFLRIPKGQRAILLKALLVHTASWPEDTNSFLQQVLGPVGRYYSKRRKDNVRRMIGYGFADPERAIACADDRATFWTVGTLDMKKGVQIDVPIPVAYGSKARPHTISSTLAWTTPVAPGRKAYKSIRLILKEPAGLSLLGVTAYSGQPDHNDVRRGTVSSRTWEGAKSAVVLNDEQMLSFFVQREADLGDDDVLAPISFALAITIAMPGVNTIYSEVAPRIAPHLRPRQRV